MAMNADTENVADPSISQSITEALRVRAYTFWANVEFHFNTSLPVEQYALHIQSNGRRFILTVDTSAVRLFLLLHRV